MGEPPRFDAFISYSHTDKPRALRLQRHLESARLPGSKGSPRRRLRVFRDDTDIRAAGLTAELQTALASSAALVVCCSPSAARSDWVRKEIDLFLDQDPSRPVIPILLAGDADTAVPPRLAADHRYVDARRAWLLGILRPAARDELARAVAAIAREDLRTFVPWARRRRRRLLAAWSVAFAGVVVASLFVPFERTRALGRPAGIDPQAVIEFCDVADGKLLVAARATYGRGTIENPSFAGYVAIHDDVLGPPGKPRWIDETGYLPRGRLLHIGTSRGVRQHAAGFDIRALRARALQAAQWHALDAGGEPDEDTTLERGFWAAAPAPETRLVLIAIKPSRFDPAAADGPAPGSAVIAIKDGDAPEQIGIVEGLYPPPLLTDRPPPPRSADLSRGLPIAVTSSEVLVGMPVRADGGTGGLWRWDRAARSWRSENFSRQTGNPHGNVVSIVADPQRPGRVLLSAGPGDWNTGARKGRYAAGLYERPAADASWRAVTTLSLDSESHAQLCGLDSEGTLFVRVNQALFATGRYNLLRWLRQAD